MSIVSSLFGGDAGGGGGATNTATVGQVEASGPSSVAITQPHIVQYPRPPKRDDGRWLALSTVIGNIIGKLSSQSIVKEARKLEGEWREIMYRMRDRGYAEWERVNPLRDKAKDAMTDLDGRNVKNWTRADQEFAYQERLKPCIDNMADELCQLADCGYQPDYDGIYARVAADAALAEQQEFDKLCRIVGRYNRGWECDMRGKLLASTQALIIGQTNKLREAERQLKWQHDAEIKLKTFETMERARQGRHNTAQSYDKTAIDVRTNQYRFYTADADNSLKMGADLLASSGQNAAWLADSLRKTAKDAMADWGALAAMIGTLLLSWNSKGSSAKTDECGGGGGGNSFINALF